jgi:nitroreductase
VTPSITSEAEAEIILRALRERRSIGKVRPEMPPREAIEQIIEAAGWAPNHYRTAPWRFVVLAGEARGHIGDVMARSLGGRLEDPDNPECQQLVERERRKPLRAPVVIAVAAVPSSAAKVRENEEVAATAAAVENMLIAARALGLGAMWRTGAPAYDPAVKDALGLPENAHLVAFVYVGYPDLPPAPDQRQSALMQANWLGWPA